MKALRWVHAISFAAALGLGAIVAGCSQGSGTPYVGAPQATTAAPATVNPDREDAVAVGFSSTELGGEVSALGTTGQGEVLAARGSDVLRVKPGQEPQQELTLGSTPTSFATVGEQVFMGTQADTGGALLVRSVVDGQVSWQPVLETDARSVSVASVGSVAVVLTGGAPYDGEVLRVGANGGLESLGKIPSTQPTNAVGFSGALYVAGVTPLSGGLASARVARVEQEQVSLLVLPVVSNHGGALEQRVSGFGVRATEAGGQELVVVVGEHDAASGDPLGGYVAVSDGFELEVVARFDHEPQGTAWIGDQPFVGFDDGKLLTASEGTWREVTGLPATLGIETLTADGETLWVAARGPNGARLFAQAPAVDEFANLPRGFVDGIHDLLSSSCTPCHSDPSRSFRLGVDPAADFSSTQSFVDTAGPESSSLLTKATGSTPHGGGAILTPEDPRYADLLTWIEQGAPEQAGQVNYTEHVAPIFAAVNCVRCHDLASQRPYLMSTTGDLEADYRITVAYMDPDDVENSELLLRTSATLPHPAQGIPNPSPRRDVVVRWVADGMQLGPLPPPE